MYSQILAGKQRAVNCDPGKIVALKTGTKDEQRFSLLFCCSVVLTETVCVCNAGQQFSRIASFLQRWVISRMVIVREPRVT